MRRKRFGIECPVKFYVALQGNKRPEEYIRLGKLIEKLGFDRVYVYDDLMYRPSWLVLSLLAANTNSIELGPCAVNGFYRHPAIIAENAVFLDEICGGRSVLGLGRGAFLEYLGMPTDEYSTRKVCEETIQLVKRFIARDNSPFTGKHFEAREEAVLRWQPARENIPLVLASWNEKMAFLAGQYCDEMQVAESWDPEYLGHLYKELRKGAEQAGREQMPHFSIGGITCIANDHSNALRAAKQTLAVYLPYLTSIMTHMGLDTENDTFETICNHSKNGQYEDAASLITDDVAGALSLSGEPGEVRSRLEQLIDNVNIKGILFSPPYGALDSIEDNLKLIMNQVVIKIKKKYG